MFKKLLYNLNIIKKDHWVHPFVYIGNSLKPVWHQTDKINPIVYFISYLNKIIMIQK